MNFLYPAILLEIVAKNLTQTQLLAIFDADASSAEQKYRELFQQLVRYFEWNRSLAPQDSAQEALKRGFARLQEGAEITTENPAGFFFGIARNLLREGWRTSCPESLEDCGPERAVRYQPLYNLHHSEQKVFLRECLCDLPADDLKMLLAYVEGEGESWARRAGITIGALHTRVHRLRRHIEERLRCRSNSGTSEKIAGKSIKYAGNNGSRSSLA